MKLRLLFALTALLLACAASHAQTFEPGLLVRSTGDTLRGEIENGFWAETPEFIHYRHTGSRSVELFRPHQLRAVMFTQGRYFRYEALPIDHAAENRLELLPRAYQPNIRIDSVLAEVLLEGPASLLRVVRLSGIQYFIRRAGKPVLNLSERKYLRSASNGRLIITDGNNYHGQLGIYFGDCAAAGTDAQTAPFTAAGLAQVVQTYNTACVAAPQPVRSWMVAATVRQRAAFGAGVLAGGSYFTRSYTATEGRVFPFAGLYGELLLPNRTASLFGEMSVNSFHNQSTALAYSIANPYVKNGQTYYTYTPVYGTFNYQSIQAMARLGLRYFFPLPHEQQFFLAGGIEYFRLLNPSSTPVAGPTISPEYSDYAGNLDNPLPFVGIGWRWKHFTSSFDALFFNNIYALHFGLAYRLGRNPDAVRTAASQ